MTNLIHCIHGDESLCWVVFWQLAYYVHSAFVDDCLSIDTMFIEECLQVSTDKRASIDEALSISVHFNIPVKGVAYVPPRLHQTHFSQSLELMCFHLNLCCYPHLGCSWASLAATLRSMCIVLIAYIIILPLGELWFNSFKDTRS